MTKKTKELINSIREYLINQYGNIQPQWELTLTLLQDNIEMYQQCKLSINQNGIYDAESGKKNPLLSTVKDIQATIIKQIQHLGLTPYASSKIKQEIEDDSDSFIESLTK